MDCLEKIYASYLKLIHNDYFMILWAQNLKKKVVD